MTYVTPLDLTFMLLLWRVGAPSVSLCSSLGSWCELCITCLREAIELVVLPVHSVSFTPLYSGVPSILSSVVA